MFKFRITRESIMRRKEICWIEVWVKEIRKFRIGTPRGREV